MSKEAYGHGLGDRYSFTGRTDKGTHWIDTYVVENDGARRKVERTVPKRQRRS